MYLTSEKIPKNIKDAIYLLQADDQFQKIFRNDHLLDYLQAQKHDKNIQFQELQLALGNGTVIGRNIFRPLTMALYCYLYSIKSNIIFDIMNINQLDLDIFFYLLQTQDFDYDVVSLLKKAKNYCQDKLGISYNEAYNCFNVIRKFNFKVFSLFPKTAGDDSQPLYNVDWMIGIASRIKSLTSYSTKELYTKISLSEIYYYYSHYLRMKCVDGIFIRSDEEILDQMDSRMIDLVLDRLIFKKVITNEERKTYYDLLKNKPGQEKK